MGYTEKTAKEISLELLDGWTTDTSAKNDCTVTIEERQNMFTAEKTVSVKNFQPREVGAAFDRIKLKIMRNEIEPDEGTLRDIKWLTNYVEFGVFVQNCFPDWHRCDKCHSVRLCIHSVMDLSCICFECRYKDRVMDDVDNGVNLESEPIRDFLQTGNLDPSTHWKTYSQLVKEQFEDFHSRLQRYEDTKRELNIQLMRRNNGA